MESGGSCHFCLTLGDRRNSMTMGELSQVLLLPMSTATRIVEWLVEGAGGTDG